MIGVNGGMSLATKSAILLVGSLTLGFTLQACSNPGPTLLGEQDIPAYLHIVSSVSIQTNDAHAPRHCGSVAETFFTPPGKGWELRPIGPGVVIRYVQVMTATYSCASVSDARRAFREIYGQVTPLVGFGNQAVLIATVSAKGRQVVSTPCSGETELT